MIEHDKGCDRSCDCSADPDREDDLLSKLERRTKALELIIETPEGQCERTTRGDCKKWGYTKGAEYSADAWCDTCIAREALDSPVEGRSPMAESIAAMIEDPGRGRK